MNPNESPAVNFADALVDEYGAVGALRVLEQIWKQLPVHERAALAYDFAGFWARPKQVFPDTWRSLLLLTSRGTGKTTCCASHIVGEAMEGRAMQIGCAAQKEEKTIAVQIVGLQDASPPWFKPAWEATKKQLVWPNGAVAYAFTPEAPEAMRSPNLHLCWLSEFQSWPAATREEAYSNIQFATRVGYARTLIDATPKRGHPMLKALVAQHRNDPSKYRLIDGRVEENIRNLGSGVIRDWRAKWDDTSKGREELDGVLLDEAEHAMFTQGKIDENRRPRPERFVRSALGIDCAVTERGGSDMTGMVAVGLCADGKALVFKDMTGKHSPSVWAKLAIDTYVAERIDVIAIETNKGGSLVVQNLRAEAQTRNLKVVVVGDKEVPQYQRGIVYVRERYARGAKQDRAQPVAVAYEKGRVGHALGADLASLEETLTTWEPGPSSRSPDDLDALVHAIVELLELKDESADPSEGFKGIEQVAARIQDAHAPQSIMPSQISSLLLGHGGRRGRI